MIVYTFSYDVASVRYGRENESIALNQLANQENIVIDKCGLFLDNDHSYLGASPDGVVGSDILIEIKCPSSASGIPCDEAIKKKKITFWKYQNDTFIVQKTHNCYYQIQGQLHIANRRKCLFPVWTGPNFPLKVVTIERDDDFWRDKMVNQLKIYFLECFCRK